MKFNRIMQGDGRPVLMLHDLGGSWRTLEKVRDLVASNREVIVIDIPGFGSTPKLKGEVTISRLADEIIEYIKENNLVGADAFGISLGGNIILEILRRGNIFGKVVVASPIGFAEGKEKRKFYFPLITLICIVRICKYYLPRLAGKPEKKRFLIKSLSYFPTEIYNIIVLSYFFDLLMSKSYSKVLWQMSYGEQQAGIAKGTIEDKLLIIWGRKDKLIKQNQIDRIHENFPDAKLEIIEDSGHYIHWDQPKELVKSIKNFLTNDEDTPDIVYPDKIIIKI
ncbi:MAG: alpha/beta hydrolase [Bacteroidia bacterium]|nr:alpha/beta hydrolase [Bacteroidia bacterium]